MRLIATVIKLKEKNIKNNKKKAYFKTNFDLHNVTKDITVFAACLCVYEYVCM